jgi:hypothetical protein
MAVMMIMVVVMLSRQSSAWSERMGQVSTAINYAPTPKPVSSCDIHRLYAVSRFSDDGLPCTQ